MDNDRSVSLPYQTKVLARNRLSSRAFELVLAKPAGFDFRAGQKVTLAIDSSLREYSLASAPGESSLHFCVRRIEDGIMSSRLAELQPGERLSMSAPHGYFVYRKGRAVLVGTGTGIAPFVSYCRSGISDFVLLHGVRTSGDLYYREELRRCAALYVPCISGPVGGETEGGIYPGRVTDYLRKHLPKQAYTFYLCGNGEMIRDAIRIIDSSFPAAKIFTETFHH